MQYASHGLQRNNFLENVLWMRTALESDAPEQHENCATTYYPSW